MQYAAGAQFYLKECRNERLLGKQAVVKVIAVCKCIERERYPWNVSSSFPRIALLPPALRLPCLLRARGSIIDAKRYIIEILYSIL